MAPCRSFAATHWASVLPARSLLGKFRRKPWLQLRESAWFWKCSIYIYIYNQVRNWWHMLKARHVWRMPHWNLLVSYGNVQRLQLVSTYKTTCRVWLPSICRGNILELVLWIYRNPPKSDQISYGLCMVYVEFDSVTTWMESGFVWCRRRKAFYWNVISPAWFPRVGHHRCLFPSGWLLPSYLRWQSPATLGSSSMGIPRCIGFYKIL